MNDPPSQKQSPAIRYEREGDVGRIIVDQPGKPVNVMNAAALNDLEKALDAAQRDRPPLLVLASGKPGTFVAGADVFEMTGYSRDELDAYLKRGQELFSRIEDFPAPTVALISGAALGGGLEIALACDWRVAADGRGTRIGLPEVTLGLIPAWGGCVRLPRLIGPEPAANLITSGNLVDAAEAKRVGVVDEVAPADQLQSAATSLARRGKRSRDEKAAEGDERRRVLSLIRQKLEGASWGQHYPAPMRALEVIQIGLAEGVQAGLDAERQGLCDLRQTPAGQNLLRIFALKQNARRAATKAAGGTPKDLKQVAVIGGGTMGAGIAYVMLGTAKLPVVLIETDEQRAAGARQRVEGLFDADVAKGRMKADAAEQAKGRLTTTARFQAIEDSDLVIEAAFEDMQVKRELFARLDADTKPEAVLATNTSSLSVTELAKVTKSPARVVGLHYFNPVTRMALVEVVKTKHSDPGAVATAVAAATACGKTPVVVNDAPGFVVNRVLFPYLYEAMLAVGEGGAPEEIDAAVRAWGMPMGPLELIDTIGLDVTLNICEAMRPSLSPRVNVPTGLGEAVSAGQLGRKSDSGFFRYEGGKRGSVSQEVIGLFRAGRSGAAASGGLPERVILPMINEAARVVEEGVVDSTDAIDLATLLGLGLAPFRGGVARFIDDESAEEIVRQLELLAERYGERFEPAPLLVRAADEGKPLASYARAQ